MSAVNWNLKFISRNIKRMIHNKRFFINNLLIISVDYYITRTKINFSDNDKFELFHVIINEISILKIYNYLNTN